MGDRLFNFSAGPATLPLPVLERAQKELLCLPGIGASVLEISHRSPAFSEIIDGAEANIRKLLDISDDYAVLFLQGGGRLQFSMIPMNLMSEDKKSADYVLTGTWGKKAAAEAKSFGTVRTAYSAADSNFNHAPTQEQLDLDPNAAYLYYCCNETIQGVQFKEEPVAPEGVPVICDASSDFLHRKIDVNKYGMIFACAQKNVGPAGLTIAIIRKDLAERSGGQYGSYLNYKTHIEEKSLGNTPPTFAIYINKLVTEWLLEEYGTLDKMHEQNQLKAAMLYDTIDTNSEFYVGHAQLESRSLMNVAFRLPSDDLTAKFLAESKAAGLTDLKGHRSVGGIRASIYNPMPVAGVEKLRDFMSAFCKQNA